MPCCICTNDAQHRSCMAAWRHGAHVASSVMSVAAICLRKQARSLKAVYISACYPTLLQSKLCGELAQRAYPRSCPWEKYSILHCYSACLAGHFKAVCRMGYVTEEPSTSCALCHKEGSMQCISCLRNGVEKGNVFCGPECFKTHFQQHRPGYQGPPPKKAPAQPAPVPVTPAHCLTPPYTPHR